MIFFTEHHRVTASIPYLKEYQRKRFYLFMYKEEEKWKNYTVCLETNKHKFQAFPLSMKINNLMEWIS